MTTVSPLGAGISFANFDFSMFIFHVPACRSVPQSATGITSMAKITIRNRVRMSFLLQSLVLLRSQAWNNLSSLPNGKQLLRVVNILQRVRVQDQKIRLSARLQRAEFSFSPQDPGICTCSSDDRLHGCKSGLYHQLQLSVLEVTRKTRWHSGIRPERNFHSSVGKRF